MSRRDSMGLWKPRGCCLFTWREAERGETRIVEIGPEHCDECVRMLAEQIAAGENLQLAYRSQAS